MQFDIHLRDSVKEQIEQVAQQMKSWENKPRMDAEERELVSENIVFFKHSTKRAKKRYTGIDGSGDFPAVSYADSFVYVTVANGAIYETEITSGLQELESDINPIALFTWLPEDQWTREDAYDQAFAELAGMSLDDVIQKSDFRILKAQESHRPNNVDVLIRELIRPHASDYGNIAIQLRSAGEFGIALRYIQSAEKSDYVLVDTTLSLPSVILPTGSLFYEHVKRLCCVEARDRGIGFYALSKSHGLPSMDLIEEVVREKADLEAGKNAEHWYLRIPKRDQDGWELSLAEGRRLPPAGAVTYLIRFHKNTPVLRLDMDKQYWLTYVKGENDAETQESELRIFKDLDYACHDQRSYGYPYPIKASHDRASLTKQERISLRKQIIDAAVKAGMKRSLFRDVSMATGHA